jgi:acyl dehydratase
MAMLTHPLWPLPIWNALQVRNRMTLYRPLNGEPANLIARPAGWRVLDKGIEVDLYTRLQQGNDCLWDSVATFYYRGRPGAPAERTDRSGADAVTPAIDPFTERPHHWQIGDGGRWQFCGLTGDYNGLHLWDRYARRFGFKAAFPHPQRVLAQCLGHLVPSEQLPRRLDLWIKGPAYFGSHVVQREPLRDNGDQDFALWIEGEARPALVGRAQRLTPEAVSEMDDADALPE